MIFLFVDLLINKLCYFNSYLFLIPLIYYKKNFFYYLIIGLTLDIFICNTYLNTLILSLLYLANRYLLIKVQNKEIIYFINYLFYFILISLVIGHSPSLLDLFNLITNTMIFKIWDIYHHQRIKLIG